MAVCNVKHVLLTGPPGVGKTTLIQKLCVELQSRGVPLKGFYTEECRDSTRQRIGFDVVSLDGQRAPLARTGEAASHCTHYVGKYGVLVSSFEQVALPLMTTAAATDSTGGCPPVVIIDEIGKMELFSDNFAKAINHLFDNKRSTVVATIPIKRGRDIKFVESIRGRRDARLFELSRENRDSILKEVADAVASAAKSH